MTPADLARFHHVELIPLGCGYTRAILVRRGRNGRFYGRERIIKADFKGRALTRETLVAALNGESRNDQR